MALILYQDANIPQLNDNIPILIEGYNNHKNKCWFYIGPSDWSLTFAKIPYVIHNGKMLFIRRGSKQEIKDDQFILLHTHLKQSESNTYMPGDVVEFNELARILSESGIEQLTSTSMHTIYTLFVDTQQIGSYGWTNIVPYYSNNNYTLLDFGPSKNITGMNLKMISDDYLLSTEWNIIMGTIYEQIIRGLSSIGNWEILSNTEYGSIFQLKSGWGYPEICINNDITFKISHTPIEKTRRAFLVPRIQRIPFELANIICPIAYRHGTLNSILHRYVDFSRYDLLFKNAGIKDE